MAIVIDKLVRSNRKSVGIEIKDDATLLVRAPRQVALKTIHKVLKDKEAWIVKHQAAIKAKRSETPLKNFLEGELFLFQGEEYKLTFSDDLKEKFAFDRDIGFIVSSQYVDSAEQIILKWYKRHAKHVITECVEYYAEKFDIPYNRIRISNAKTRWGSCSSLKNLNFSWRLIKAPINVIDYVVVHELAHIIEMNHSNAFWTEVEQMLPNYKQEREWLHSNQYKLHSF